LKTPNFFCIGAQKSGTTLLHELLKDIDDVYLPSKKEIHFFDQDLNFEKGLDWYECTYFSNSDKCSAVGEITPSYIFIDEVPKRIKDCLGDEIKFILILRNPIERAYSQYIMKYKSKEEIHSFNDALLLENSRTKDDLQNNKQYSYLARGLYSKQISNYLNYFNKEQFLFIEFEDFVKNQDSTLKEICDFLNIKKDKKIVNKVIHTSKLSLFEKVKFNFLNNYYNPLSLLTSSGYPKMSRRTRRTLMEYYKDDILALEKIIDKDLSAWLQ